MNLRKDLNIYMVNKNKPLTVEILEDQIIISIGLETLKMVQEHGSCSTEGKIIDLDEFAQDVHSVLIDEDESGINMVMDMIDEAIEKAMENGSEGIKYV